MRQIVFVSMLFLVATASCKKETPELTGKAATAAFTFDIIRSPGGDTLPFTNKVSFKNNSTDAFSYLWNFGDANTSVLANPVHEYEAGSSFNIKLTSVGKRGTDVKTGTVEFDSPCDYEPFKTLTSCSNKKWSVSPAGDAITILAQNGTDVLSVQGGLPCLIDDQYTFNVAGGMNYDSKGQTFLANEGPTPYSCQQGQANAKFYYMIKGSNGVNPRLVLMNKDVNRVPFLGTTDPVVGNQYEILSLNEEEMVLQADLLDGKKLRLKFVNASITVNSIRFFLSGGGRKSWKLDPAAGANPIVAGTEPNPTTYFGGGPLAPCQINDFYTFTNTDSVYASFGGDALIYGGPGDYNCGEYGNFAGKYTMGPVQGSGAGNAQFVLDNGASQFVAVMDRVENVYRILEVTNTKLVIRVGSGSGTVQTLKFIPR